MSAKVAVGVTLLLVLAVVITSFVAMAQKSWQNTHKSGGDNRETDGKKLRGGGKAHGVRLLPDGTTVEKSYNTHRKRSMLNFHIEMYLMHHLRDCPFVPKLLWVDWSTATFRMTYCGKVAPHTSEVRKQVNHLMGRLESEWGLRRAGTRQGKYSVCAGNRTMDEGGKVWIIDFGSVRWRMKNWHTRAWCPVKEMPDFEQWCQSHIYRS